MKFLKNNWPIILIIILGLGLRLYHLGSQGLWIDEIPTAIAARSNILNIHNLYECIYVDLNPPLYVILLHFWIKLAGTTETSLRLLSVLFGVLSILAIYKVGFLLFNKKVALLAAFFLSISSFHLLHSQELRMYSLLSLLSLMSIYFYWKLLKKPSIEYTIVYLIFTLLLLFSHTFGFLTVIAENVFMICVILIFSRYFPLKLKQWLLIQLFLLMIFAPWLIIIVLQINLLPYGSVTSPYRNLQEMFGSPLIWIPLAISVGLSICLFKKPLRALKYKFSLMSRSLYLTRDPNVYFLIIFIIVNFSIPWLIYYFAHLTVNYPRILIPAAIAIFLLAAKGITNIKNTLIKSVLILLIIISLGVYVVSYFQNVSNDDWRGLAQFVDKNAPPNARIMIMPDWVDTSILYYLRREDIKIVPIPVDSASGNLNESWEKLKAEASKSQKFYLITYTFSVHFADSEITTLLPYQLISKENFTGMNLYYFENKLKQ